MRVRDEDLKQTSVELEVTNSASGTSSRLAGSDSIVEVEPSGLALRIPRGIGEAGHVLSLRIVVKEADRVAQELLLTGKVVSIDRSDAATAIVQIRLYQMDEQKWDEFCRRLVSRQSRANELLEARKS